MSTYFGVPEAIEDYEMEQTDVPHVDCKAHDDLEALADSLTARHKESAGAAWLTGQAPEGSYVAARTMRPGFHIGNAGIWMVQFTVDGITADGSGLSFQGALNDAATTLHRMIDIKQLKWTSEVKNA